MNVHELIGKRILITGAGMLNSRTIACEEIKIIEVSPSGNWVKTQTLNGQKVWRRVGTFALLEVLTDITTVEPKPKE